MIGTVEQTVMLYKLLIPYVTEDIWFGKMNTINGRVSQSTLEERAAVEAIQRNQTDENILSLYRQLQDQDKVRWKGFGRW